MHTESRKLRGNSHDVEIENELSRSGLDPKHWLPVFKKQLGVTSTQALKYIGSGSYADLQRFTRKPQERERLHQFLYKESTQWEQHKKLLQKIHENSQQMLQQLKELNEEGKGRNDSTVQLIENGICEALQIPTDSWIPQDEALQMVIGHLDTFIDQMDRTLATSDISDTLVVQNASGGRALQGIFLNRDLKEQLKSRARLLKVPEGIRLVGPSLSRSELVMDFSSKMIEKLIPPNLLLTLALDKCEEFFHKYGSHVNVGPIHFGAIHWQKSFNQGYPESLKSTVKECQINALRVKARLGTSRFFNRKKDFQGAYSESLTSVTYVEEGGNPEGSSWLWKASLVASNSTWSLIDRGTNTVPVWEIIQVQ